MGVGLRCFVWWGWQREEEQAGGTSGCEESANIVPPLYFYLIDSACQTGSGFEGFDWFGFGVIRSGLAKGRTKDRRVSLWRAI